MADFLCNSVVKKRKYYHYLNGNAGTADEVCGTIKGKVKIADVHPPVLQNETCPDGRPIYQIVFK